MRKMMFSLLAGAVLLTGCAGLPTDTKSDIDFYKVARIENAARSVGVSVYWVNYPTKSTASIN
ncbi:MAG: hypothetical protein ABI854_02005 [Betaproteobacteria bacterium]